MKKYFLRASAIAVMAALFSTSVFAQEQKEKVNKLSEGDEVIIIKKGAKDAKVTVEVKDGEVTVNGKPLSEYKEGDIVVRKNKTLLNGSRVYAPSPFRAQGWSQGDANIVDFHERAYLGVTTEKDDNGARITNVNDNTAAAKAGLKDGDVITHIGETRVEDHDDLSAAVRKHKPEEKVSVTYRRDGKEQKATATLGKSSGSMAMTAPSFNFDFDNDFEGLGRAYSMYGRPRLGIRAQDTEDGKGVKVLGVDEGSVAEKAGIKKDDLITEFEGKEINSADQLANAARSTKDKSSMNVKVTRDGRSQTMELKIPKKLKTTTL